MAAMAITGTALTSCSESNAPQDGESAIIGKHEIKIEGGLMTPEALWAMGRIGEVSVSPDAQTIIYGVSYYSVKQNKSHHTLNIMNADGSNTTKLTTTADNETSAAWIKGGTKIAFLSNASGSSQVWEMNPDGSERRQLTHDKSDIEFFGTKGGAKLSPELELYSDVNGYLTNTQLDFPTALSFNGLFENEISHFLDCIIDGVPCQSPAEDGVEIMKILDAIYESARTGHEVTID